MSDPTSETEARWRQLWQDTGVYRYDPSRGRDETFVIDTPPPTASGSLHIGSVCSYTHTDLMARYRRMRGDNIFYPMGWDDNGLPTERRVQNVFNVRPDPSLPYDPALEIELGRRGKTLVISRQNFIELCARVLEEDEQLFRDVFERIALSVDWGETYATIDRHCRRVSQWSFLRLVEHGEAELREAPTMWDVDFQTALAQAEVEDRVEEGAYYRVRFGLEGDDGITIATTRPELLASCIAVIAHPDDARYRSVVGKQAITPLYGAAVPVLAHDAAEPDKGTGIMMVCTFGDASDVERWRELGVAPRTIIGRDGRIQDAPWGDEQWASIDPEKARSHHKSLVGLPVDRARKEVVHQLGEAGALDGEPEPIRRPVRFYERGERPLEYVTSRQWFVKILEHKDALLEQGRKIAWHPESMLRRYEDWVLGLNYDWPVSRQRPFGVPIPVWYVVDEHGEADHSQLILPARDDLPVDPSSEAPSGYREDRRGKPGGFVGDPDVFDTWATSSLTPLLTSGWPDDLERHKRLYPSDLRPNAHEIIRTWDFYTITRSYLEDGSIPWHNVAISGFVTDPERKKMSKSKGNVILPTEPLDQYGTDAVRYWAASARLGIDAVADPNVFREGKRLVTKVRNAARFVLALGSEPRVTAEELRPLDRALIARLREVIDRATSAWEAWDHAGALAAVESWFWSDFCDNYLELVKERAYAGDSSAVSTLRLGLDVVLRLFAPILPYVTEEIWNSEASDRLPSVTGSPATPALRSIHRAPWPTRDELAGPSDSGCFDSAVSVLSAIRRAKSDAKVSIKSPVRSLDVVGPAQGLDALSEGLEEVLAAGNVSAHTLVADPAATDLTITVSLASE
jgi:valyl-tRNA synthetase